MSLSMLSSQSAAPRDLLRSLAAVLLYVDRHAHPRMNAALKVMLSLRQTRNLELAALQDPGLGHIEIAEAAGTFGNRFLSSIEIVNEAATELLHLGEGVRLTTLIAYDQRSSFLDFDNVRFEVPVR